MKKQILITVLSILLFISMAGIVFPADVEVILDSDTAANAGFVVKNLSSLEQFRADADGVMSISGIGDEPSVPASDYLKIYTKNIGGRMMLKWVGPAGLDTPLQPFLAMNKVIWWNAAGNSTIVTFIGGNLVTAFGQVAARNVTTTNLFNRMKRIGYRSGTVAGIRMPSGIQFTVGTGGLGGFNAIFRFGISDGTSLGTRARMFVGMSFSAAAPTSVEMATQINCIGVGQGTGDTNLEIYYGGSAAQTPINLGTAFPTNTTNIDMYELALFAFPNSSSSVGYRVQRLNTGNKASGTLTAATPGTQLPSSTLLLAPLIWRGNAGGTVGEIDVSSIYLETDQ